MAFLSLNCAQALTLNYRHELTDYTRNSTDRLILSSQAVSNKGLSLELKAKAYTNHEDGTFSELKSNGAELVLSYEFKHRDNLNLTLKPAFNAEFSNKKRVYKSSFLLNYTFKSGIFVAMRLRFDAINNYQGQGELCRRFDTWLGLTKGPFLGVFKYVFYKSDQIRFNRRKEDHEYDFKRSDLFYKFIKEH